MEERKQSDEISKTEGRTKKGGKRSKNIEEGKLAGYHTGEREKRDNHGKTNKNEEDKRRGQKSQQRVVQKCMGKSKNLGGGSR